jgi:hypothetical protein
MWILFDLRRFYLFSVRYLKRQKVSFQIRPLSRVKKLTFYGTGLNIVDFVSFKKFINFNLEFKWIKNFFILLSNGVQFFQNKFFRFLRFLYRKPFMSLRTEVLKFSCFFFGILVHVNEFNLKAFSLKGPKKWKEKLVATVYCWTTATVEIIPTMF